MEFVSNEHGSIIRVCCNYLTTIICKIRREWVQILLEKLVILNFFFLIRTKNRHKKSFWFPHHQFENPVQFIARHFFPHYQGVYPLGDTKFQKMI
jgi:hypothetical protein